MLKFDPEKHEYSRNGKRLPSVTEIINKILYPDQFRYVNEEVLELAAEFGRSVHKALDTNFADPLTDEELHCYNEAIKILQENNITPILKETRIDSKLGYAGTFDLYGIINGKKALFDYKTGTSLNVDQTAWQQSMYKVALEEQGNQVDDIYAIHIPKKRKGKLVKLQPRNLIEVEWLVNTHKERIQDE